MKLKVRWAQTFCNIALYLRNFINIGIRPVIMFVKLLGLMDIASAVIIAFFSFGIASTQILVGASLYLVIKAAVFFGDFISIIDGIVGIVTILNILMHIGWITYVTVVYLIAKGIISMI
jgi:hypothetical protein